MKMMMMMIFKLILLQFHGLSGPSKDIKTNSKIPTMTTRNMQYSYNRFAISAVFFLQKSKQYELYMMCKG